MFIPQATTTDAERQSYEEYFQRINDIAVAEDYGLVDKIVRGLNCGIERKLLVGRNEPGVQNMHRQIRDALGYAC